MGNLWFYHFHLVWGSESMNRTSRAQYLHCRSLVSMSSSSDRKSTTRTTQATRTQLKRALSRQTCHRATRRPQQGFSQFDLWEANVRTFSTAQPSPAQHSPAHTCSMINKHTHKCLRIRADGGSPGGQKRFSAALQLEWKDYLSLLPMCWHGGHRRWQPPSFLPSSLHFPALCSCKEQ